MKATSLEKHEFYKGEIFAVAGGTIANNRIIINVATEVGDYLRK